MLKPYRKLKWDVQKERRKKDSVPGDVELLGCVLATVAHVELVVDIRQPVAHQPVLQVHPAVRCVTPSKQ